jgi:hypothetical protein
MSEAATAFHRHARSVLDHELRRARGTLAALPSDRRVAVEELTVRVTTALVDGVFEQARGEPALAQALGSIYGTGVGEPKLSLRLGLESQGGS